MPPTDRQFPRLPLARLALELHLPAAAAVTYYVAAQSAFLVGTLSDRIFAPFWPPNVVLLCVVLLAPWRRWPLYFATVLLAHAIAEAGIGMGAGQALIAYATNCAAAFIGGMLLRATVARPPWLGTSRSAVLYIVITAGIAPAAAAFGGAFVPIFGGGSIEDYWVYWGHWYVANALACLTLGPILLSWLGAPDQMRLLRPARWSWESVGSTIMLIALCATAMKLIAVVGAPYFPTLVLLPLPAVLWMTFRFGVRGASTAILVVTVMLVSHALDDRSPLAANDVETNVLALQLLLTGLSVPVLLLGAAADETKVVQAATGWLVGSILSAQDRERRHVARELHDNTGQNLVAATLLLSRIQESKANGDVVPELNGLLQSAIAGLRRMSYGLHPPLLDEAGLPLALQSYLGSLRAGSGFNVDVDLPDDIERLPEDVELVLFRVIQETLDSLQRHTDSRGARILLSRGGDAQRPNVVLTIENDGAEAPRPFLSRILGCGHHDPLRSFGLAGIRERIRQLGGVLELRSAPGLTLVRATVPLNPS